MKRNKISLIGAGQIGGTLAYLLMLKKLGDIVLIDINEGTAKGKALDIFQASTIENSDTNIIGSSDYSNIADSDVIIVTAGIARTGGDNDRNVLLETNTKIISSVAGNIKKYAPNAFVIVVTNPLDIMTHVMLRETGFSKNKVVGMAGVLDSARFSAFLAIELDVSVEDINSFVIGVHGNGMLPLIRYTTVGGVALTDIIKMGRITQAKVDEITERTKNGGAEIVNLLQNGSAFYTPASSAVYMAEAYLQDKKKILPASVYLEREYGLDDVCIGVPVVIGKNGVEEIIQVNLEEGELNSLRDTCSEIKKCKF